MKIYTKAALQDKFDLSRREAVEYRDIMKTDAPVAHETALRLATSSRKNINKPCDNGRGHYGQGGR